MGSKTGIIIPRKICGLLGITCDEIAGRNARFTRYFRMRNVNVLTVSIFFYCYNEVYSRNHICHIVLNHSHKLRWSYLLSNITVTSISLIASLIVSVIDSAFVCSFCPSPKCIHMLHHLYCTWHCHSGPSLCNKWILLRCCFIPVQLLPENYSWLYMTTVTVAFSLTPALSQTLGTDNFRAFALSHWERVHTCY